VRAEDRRGRPARARDHHAEKAKRQGVKPPTRPKFKRVGDVLAESESATFDAALCYHGTRPARFVQIFAKFGKIYHEWG
jgi:hypothetical protein